MRHHNPIFNQDETAFINLDTRLCQACWKCMAACQHRVLGKIDLPFHKHVRIARAAKCKGCKKCVQACHERAITFIYTAYR